MQNLAGKQDCDIQIKNELLRARINIVRGKPREGQEVPATLTGRLGPFTFWRAWYYWVVNGRIPLAVAEELYKDPVGREDVRVVGHCGCPPPNKWLKWYDEEGRKLILLTEAFKECKSLSKSKSLADVANNFLHDPKNRFVHDLTEEGKAFVTSYHIDTEVGLRLFADTIKNHGLI